MRYFLYTSIFFLALTACKKEIEFKGEIGERQLVVNCIMENDSTIKASLSKSTPAIGEQNNGPDQITSSATLVLTDETTGETFTSSSVNSENMYEFPTVAKTGHKYSISVSHSEFETATASTIIPDIVTINDWDTSSYLIEGFPYKQVDVTIIDPSEDNYYIIAISSIDTISQVENVIYISASEGGYDNEYGQSLFIKDKLFNNNSKKFSMEFYPEYYYDENYNKIGEMGYKIRLYSASKETYQYLLSVSKSNESEGNPFSEPVRVYSNITNGLGIFGGIAKDEVILE